MRLHRSQANGENEDILERPLQSVSSPLDPNSCTSLREGPVDRLTSTFRRSVLKPPHATESGIISSPLQLTDPSRCSVWYTDPSARISDDEIPFSDVPNTRTPVARAFVNVWRSRCTFNGGFELGARRDTKDGAECVRERGWNDVREVVLERNGSRNSPAANSETVNGMVLFSGVTLDDGR